ncbi:heat shock protein 26-like [Sitodiplosis mosellana]|uniref:heat shock protein 26-like n=1 Tax=Sitodiplosis mosellana TaxID=263140 RepID=UPI0024446270|nr:heat shock protein 26-like [Sitodiplosis mosellana]
MSRFLDDVDFFGSRYHYVDRPRHYPSADIPFRRTLRCYRDADDYLNPRIYEKTGTTSIPVNKDYFEVCIDVQHFKPEEISVKAEKNSVVVQAKHEEKQDEHGFVSRQFIRRYNLPDGYKSEDVVSSLSSDGILSIKCATPVKVESTEERQVPIKQTHLPSSAKSSEEKKDGKETPVA